MLNYKTLEKQDAVSELPQDLKKAENAIAFGASGTPLIAFLHCMDLIDDFLDHIDISFETYCNEFVANWMYGYTLALQTVGVRTVLFCISARFTEVSRFTHVPTGATICVLPAPKSYLAYRAVRRKALNFYGAKEGQAFKDIQDSNVTRRSLLAKFKNLAQSLGTYLSTPLDLLAREIKREGCQAILCQEYEYARFDACVLLGKLMRLPVFATFQGGNETHSLLEYPFRQLAFQNCAGSIVAPQTEIERVRKRYNIPDAKIARIFNPIDLAKWSPIDRSEARTALDIPLDAKVVVYHGRIDFHRKGLDILLKAWYQICHERPETDLRLLLVGTGPDAEILHQQIAAMQLRGVMWRNEFVNHSIVKPYLFAADVYTLPSRHEGFPIAPIEAMACGLPIVAADAPGVPDILEGGEVSGGLVVPREDATALALALSRILDDETWRLELGRRARRRIEEHFALDVIGKQLRQFFMNDEC